MNFSVKLINNPLKIANFLFRKIYGYPLRPFGVLIETTNNCNFQCSFCARHRLIRKLGFMDFNLYKHIIDCLVKAKISTVRLQFFGEPLLHPQIVEMINYAKNRGVSHVNFNTNVSLLDIMKAQKILNTDLDQIQFSLDAASEEIFDIVRTKGYFGKVVNNLECFLDLKKRSGKDNLYTVLKITTTKHNFSELIIIIKKWGYLLDEVQISPATIYEDLDLSISDRKQFSRGICLEPFQKLVILWNGDVTVCCYDINGHLKIGNIGHKDILKLWRGQAINKIREKIKANKYADLVPCRSCEFANKQLMDDSVNRILKELSSDIIFRKDFNFKVDAGILYVYLNKNEAQ